MNKNFITVVLVKNGMVASVISHVTPGKAYHLVNNFSNKIGNGDLWTSKQTYEDMFEISSLNHINLSPSMKSFALVINENDLELDGILSQYNLRAA